LAADGEMQLRYQDRRDDAADDDVDGDDASDDVEDEFGAMEDAEQSDEASAVVARPRRKTVNVGSVARLDCDVDYPSNSGSYVQHIIARHKHESETLKSRHQTGRKMSATVSILSSTVRSRSQSWGQIY